MSNNITRKLIKWGSSQTLIISLPRIWVKQNNLRAEQSVRLQINPDGSLMIIPLNQDAGNMEEQEIKATISIRDPMDLDDTKLRITTKYLDGADLIELNTSKEFPSDIAELLEPLIEPLMGLEIIGVSSNRIIIRNIVPFSQTIYLIKMISNMTIEFAKNVLVLLKTRKMEHKLGDLEWQHIRKYHYRIIREQRRYLLKPSLLAQVNMTLQDVQDFSFYITNIFKIAENLHYIVDSAGKFFIPEDKFGIIKFFELVIKILETSINSFLFNDTRSAIKMIKSIKEHRPQKRTIENMVDAEEKSSKPKLITFQIVLDMIDKILDSCEDICLAGLRRAI